MASQAFLEMIAGGSASTGVKPRERIRCKFWRISWCGYGLHKRADGYWHREDFEPVWCRLGIR